MYKIKDIKAPECFYIEKRLTEELNIPVFHDDQHGTAIISGAALLNALELMGKEIEQAIRSVAAGRTHLDPAIQQRLVAAVVDSQPARPAQMPDQLTAREVEVLKLIAGGLSNAEIAASLVVSGATVKTHVNHIFQKTGVRDRAQAVRYAYEHGIA